MNILSHTLRYLIFLFLVCRLPLAYAQPVFDDWFEPKTLRFDFYLAGNAKYQSVYTDGFRELPMWGGPVTNFTRQPEYGEYFYRLYDQASGQLIYQKGFSSLFQEWRTTQEAETGSQAYNQVILMPYPKRECRLEILQRNRATGLFDPLFETRVDPGSIFINREKHPFYPVTKILDSGEPSDKVDLVFVAEGYTSGEMDKFREDAIRFTNYLFQTEPYRHRKKDFNIWAVESPSEESGVDVPGENIWKNTAFDAHFYTFNIDRYLTIPDMVAIYDRIWNVPCDAVFAIVNSDRYGGGGIYNYYGLGTAGHALSSVVFVHELGHSFAGLADEYFDSEVAYDDFYNLEVEPWEPNITTLKNFGIKWKDQLAQDTPIPTPDTEENRNKTGVYEGGGYMSKGIYRPMINCRMRDNHSEFCPVCRQAINRMIDFTIGK